MTLSASKLIAGYGRHAVTGPSDLTLRPHSTTVLIGANGTGKSTLLRTLAGAQPPIGGSVCIGGEDIRRLSRRRLAQCMSLVYTDPGNADDLTAEEVVALGRHPHTGVFGRLSAADHAEIDSAIRAVGIDSLRRRKTATLSDGERQKTMIARAVAQATPIMLLDEPTSFLDAASRIEIMQLLRKLCREHGKSILLSTHDIAPALDVADDLWVMDRAAGTLVCGTRDEVIATGVMDRVFHTSAVRFDSATLDYRPAADPH